MSGEVVTIFDELREHIRHALDEMNGVSPDGNGFYFSECDVDYRDQSDDSTVAKILRAPFPMNQLEELLQEAYQEKMTGIEGKVLDCLLENQDIARVMKNFKVSEESLRDYLNDVWYVRLPYDDFLKQKVCMDIMLDTGDANYEFTVNNLASVDIESSEDFDDNSSLLWLCEQQGVTREELLAAFDKGSAHSDEVEELRGRRQLLVSELQQFGFIVPRFAESVIHTGAYREYTKLQERLLARQGDISRLESKLEENNISYAEYLKKHFDLYQRLDPMTEEQFNVRKTEVLEKLSSRIKEAEKDLADIKARLKESPDYTEVARLQGEYRDVGRQLSELSKTEEYKKAEFINSVHNECRNAYGTGVVTFLVKMPLEEAIRLHNVIRAERDLNDSYHYEERKGLSSITIDKGVRCGLMDDCSGGGSVFEIQLLKDVEIPVRALYKAVPDRENGNYGFMEIYGADEEFFEEGLKEIHEVGRPMVNDLIANAEERAVGNQGAFHGKDSYEKD